MKYTQTIKIPKAQAKELQAFLDSKGEGGCDVVETFSAHFVEQGIGVDIKVCDGDTPYVDPVLFEVVETTDPSEIKAGIKYNWHELGPIEVSDELVGEYYFEDGDDEYIVNVEVA